MSTPLSSLSVAILATNGFEQSELTKPKQALEDAGATVHVISPESGSIKGWDQKEWGDSVSVEKMLSDASASDYVGLVLPGGQMNPDVLRMNDDAIAFVKAFASSKKPIAAICHAPWLIVEAGLAEGRDMTSWPSVRTDLKNAGATVHDKEVVRCETGPFTLITSRKPDDLPAFNETIIDSFAQVPEMASPLIPALPHPCPGSQCRGTAVQSPVAGHRLSSDPTLSLLGSRDRAGDTLPSPTPAGPVR